MISDDELLNLPDDPELAFLQYEDMLRRRVQSIIDNSEGYNIEEVKIDYISQILGLVKALELKFLEDWDLSSITSNQEYVDDNYRLIISEVSHIIVQIRIKNARRVKKYSVALDPAAKEKIRHYLGQIKEIVNKLEVSESKCLSGKLTIFYRYL